MEGLLPPGFRFYPTEEELISFYLHKKLEGKVSQIDQVIPIVDIYDHNPWILPQFAGGVCRGDPEQWFFFIPMQEKQARGGRPNRLTSEGYWKATGSPGYVYSSDNKVIGMKRTMVFYQGRAPNGRKTEWKMNEYIAIQTDHQAAASSSTHAAPQLRQELSLCRVYIKSKSVRSFDRRPSGIGAVIERPTRQALHVEEEAKITQEEKISSSQDSSSPEENANTSQTMETNSWNLDNMVFDNGPWWDWEKVNLE